MLRNEKVSIVGSGLVGKSWAMIFASAGYRVSMYDVVPSQLESSLKDISRQLAELEKEGTLRGKLEAKVQTELVSVTSDLKECLKDSVYIQECVPENAGLKVKVWKEVDQCLGKVSPEKVILGSSSSCIVPSDISKDLQNREHFIVAHPVNPPYYAPMVELVPAPWTSEWTRTKAREIMSLVGQVPVSLTKEVPGFVLNRIQYAILNESWRLISSGVVSAEDLDVVMKDGLGMRYAFLGPMETIHLNAEGTQNYFDRYGEGMYNVSNTFGDIPLAWRQRTEEDKKEMSSVVSQMESLYPLDVLQERRDRRDKALAELSKLKAKIREN